MNRSETASALDDKAAVELLERVVGCFSPSGSEAAVAGLLVDAMDGCGAGATVDEVGNAVGVWGDGPLHVTYLGHLDTVPGAIRVRVENGRLHGRGSVDAKGGLCAAVVAASRLRPATLAGLTLRVVGAVEEEAPSSRGARHAVASLPSPDLLIIGEPSGWSRYTLGYKGRLTMRLTSRLGKAHSAREEPSAAELLLDAYAAIRSWVAADNRGVERAFDRLQVTVCELTSNDDGLEESCRAQVSFRLPPRWSAAKLIESVMALLADQAPAHADPTASEPSTAVDRSAVIDAPPGPAVVLESLSAEEAYRAPSDTELARAFRVAIRSCGGSPRPTLKSGTSDMNVVATSWPVPMLAYGPGDAALDHTPDEHLLLDEYLRSVDVLVAAFDELAAAAVRPAVSD